MRYDELSLEALETLGTATTMEIVDYIRTKTGRSPRSNASISSALRTLEKYRMIVNIGTEHQRGRRPAALWRRVN